MNRTYPDETCWILEELDNIRKDLKKTGKYMDLNPENMKAADIHMQYFIICIYPESPCCGYAVGTFIHKNGRVFRFHYDVRNLRMTDISRVILKTRHGIMFTDWKDTDFGRKAFWENTPMEDLDEEERSLRDLMASIETACRNADLPF